MTDRLQDELDALAVRVGHDLTIDGLDGELLAHSVQRAEPDAARVATILLRQVPADVRDWEARHVAPDAEGPVAVPAHPGLGLTARICVPLSHHGRTVGRLWLRDPGSPLDEEPLRRGAATLAGLLAAGSAPSARAVDVLVGQLVDEGRADAYDRLVAVVPGLLDGPVEVVAAVAGGEPFGAAEFSLLRRSLTPALRAVPGYVGVHVAPAYALVLARGPAGDRLLGELDRWVTGCLGREVALGISDSRPLGPRTAREARGQALAAAELACLDPALARPARWAALGAYRPLLARPTPDAVLAPLDAAAAAAVLLATLETYLDLGGDVQATAARLGLHRSSLYYRLDRISRLLGADLANGLTRLDLHLALKSRRVRRRRLD